MESIRKIIRETLLKEVFLSEEQRQMTLYHGTPYSFKEFKDIMTFFSDNPRFAYDYASQKSMDMVLDADIKIVTVQVNTNLFNAFNDEEFKQLAAKLPEEVEVMPPKFSFMTYNLPKKEILLRMRGKQTAEPIEEVVKNEIGDKFQFNGGWNIVIDKNDTFIRAMYMPSYNGYISCAVSSDEWRDCKAYNNKDIRKFFEKYREFRFEKAKDAYKNTYLSENQVVWFWSSYSKEEDGGPSQKMRDHLKKLYDEAVDKTVKYYNDNNFGKTYNLKTEIIDVGDTWTFFENPTVIEALKELGYGGYIAKEDEHNTYAIFNPKEDVKILEISS